MRNKFCANCKQPMPEPKGESPYDPDAQFSLTLERLRAMQRCIEVLRAFMPCSCQHNVPYADGSVKREVTVKCARCKALEAWDAS